MYVTLVFSNQFSQHRLVSTEMSYGGAVSEAGGDWVFRVLVSANCNPLVL